VAAWLCGLLACAALPAQAWWNDDWALRKQIVVDTSATGANVAEGATSVPVLVRLHAGNFTRFADLKPDGADLRFIAADDATPLPFHVERLDIQQEMALVWVLLPQVAGNSDQNAFYMYFGNPEASPASDAGAPWPESHVLVWHLDDAQGALRDATRNGNHATGGAVRPYAAGLIGGGGELAGSRAAVAAPSLAVTAERGAAISAWLRLEQPQQDAVLLQLGAAAGPLLTLSIDGQAPVLTFQPAAGLPPQVVRPETASIVPATWTHLAVAVGGGELRLLLNGAVAASAPLQLAAPLAGELGFGAAADGSRAATGMQVDELRFVQGVLPEVAVRLAMASEGVGGALLAYGVDGGPDAQAAEPSYFVITLQNVTFDGWVVIVLCTVLFVLSVVVMVTKGLRVHEMRRANAKFLAAFHELGERGVDELDDAGAGTGAGGHIGRGGESGKFAASSLFHLYHLGIAETRKRTHGGPGTAGSSTALSSQTMDAIRAALHAANIREAQKLNSGMVLLTLSISGGPFLGLLGTVLGVMITFAAIAHTGEVDVAAIAPGTAAALAATVAGLSVAIPALFAYNYLTIRIREITADNEVFLDEFVTRVAEQYR
jgi:biopolymer transport protein ExbB